MASLRLLLRLCMAAALLALLAARPATADDHVVPSFAPVCQSAAPADSTLAAMQPRAGWT